MIEYEIREVHISLVRPGDVVCFCGNLMTVGRNNIKRNEFTGITLFGDCYMLGLKPVKIAVIKHAVKG